MMKSTPENSRKAAWIFRYILDRSFGTDGRGDYHSTHLSGATTFDDDLDFVVAFGEAFPGRKDDPNHLLAASRLSRMLRELAKDKWLERLLVGNQDGGIQNTPTWQYAYKLPQWLINELKTGIHTPESAAEKWGGPLQ